MTLERDSFTRFYAMAFFGVGWGLTILAIIFSCLSPLWAYTSPKQPASSRIDISRDAFTNGAWNEDARYIAWLNPPVPERRPPSTSESLWVTVTIGGILIVIRGQYPGSPPLGTYLGTADTVLQRIAADDLLAIYRLFWVL